MRSGIEWHEQDRPLDETNTTLQLERSSDLGWFHAVTADGCCARHEVGLQQRWKSVDERNDSFGDRSDDRSLRAGASLRSARHSRVALEIRTGWYSGHGGGLYLEALDLARIGQLYLDDGRCGGAGAYCQKDGLALLSRGKSRT
jgi:CubicO group peptidase (beta-lactamase class C family)